MHIQAQKFKPLRDIEISADETKILKWLKSAPWEPVAGAKEPTFKVKVPEFYNGVRLYRLQAGPGGAGGLEVLIKKLGFQGVIGKQDLYPITGHGTAPRYLSLKKPELDNLGVGQEEDEE